MRNCLSSSFRGRGPITIFAGKTLKASHEDLMDRRQGMLQAKQVFIILGFVMSCCCDDKHCTYLPVTLSAGQLNIDRDMVHHNTYIYRDFVPLIHSARPYQASQSSSSTFQEYCITEQRHTNDSISVVCDRKPSLHDVYDLQHVLNVE